MYVYWKSQAHILPSTYFPVGFEFYKSSSQTLGSLNILLKCNSLLTKTAMTGIQGVGRTLKNFSAWMWESGRCQGLLSGSCTESERVSTHLSCGQRKDLSMSIIRREKEGTEGRKGSEPGGALLQEKQ